MYVYRRFNGDDAYNKKGITPCTRCRGVVLDGRSSGEFHGKFDVPVTANLSLGTEASHQVPSQVVHEFRGRF